MNLPRPLGALISRIADVCIPPAKIEVNISDSVIVLWWSWHPLGDDGYTLYIRCFKRSYIVYYAIYHVDPNKRTPDHWRQEVTIDNLWKALDLFPEFWAAIRRNPTEYRSIPGSAEHLNPDEKAIFDALCGGMSALDRDYALALFRKLLEARVAMQALEEE
jgi:hypothetical protein